MLHPYSVDFATFCYKGDIDKLYAPGQLVKQINSNNYRFDRIIVIHQLCSVPWHLHDHDIKGAINYGIWISFRKIDCIREALQAANINLDKQYTSSTDKAHAWKYHVVNHVTAVRQSQADYIVFADADCWMVEQPEGQSWVDRGIELLEDDDSIFIVSPNDGEPGRRTMRFSQQMFMARREEFGNADFNQPNWDGNVNIPDGPMPEYWGMLEGRMELHCRVTGQCRYVLGSEYRYWHHRIIREDGSYETDRSKY